MIPKAVGPYVAYREANGFIFISGQLPINPETNSIETEDIREQVSQALKNMEAILKECGGTMSDVVSTTVLLQDINDSKAMNEEYGKFFEAPAYPVRMAYEVSKIPMGAKVEIGAIAFIEK